MKDILKYKVGDKLLTVKGEVEVIAVDSRSIIGLPYLVEREEGNTLWIAEDVIIASDSEMTQLYTVPEVFDRETAKYIVGKLQSISRLAESKEEAHRLTEAYIAGLSTGLK